MTADELRALQAPHKAKYKENPAAARYAISIFGTVEGDDVHCRVHSPRGPIDAGLHPATGGDGSLACSADMLLEALVGCAGVTMKAVATALAIGLKKATITATADLDFRGTLGVAKEAPVGLTAIRLAFDVDADAPREQIDKLIQLTERYCVIYQTLKNPPAISVSVGPAAEGKP
jgi:uncharacterized OsmC-like protein